jgi:hypothetical protein
VKVVTGDIGKTSKQNILCSFESTFIWLPASDIRHLLQEVSPLFRRMYNPFALILIGLGAVGFLVRIITDPLGLLEILAFSAAILAIFVLLYKWFIKKSLGKNVSNYQRAARQSAKRYKKQQRKAKARQSRRPSHLRPINSRGLRSAKSRKDSLEKRKQERNFTVIDGKKRKKKNRALF